MSSAQVLQALKERRDAVRIGPVVAGATGKSVLYQMLATPSAHCVALCDIQIDVAVARAEERGVTHEVVETASMLGL